MADDVVKKATTSQVVFFLQPLDMLYMMKRKVVGLITMAYSVPIKRTYVFLVVALVFHGFAAGEDETTVGVGVIIDASSRRGREEKTAMELAASKFNNSTRDKTKLLLHFRDSAGDPLRSASAAEASVGDDRAAVLVSTGTWQEAAVVAEIGSRARVPVLSFSAPVPAPAESRWPFLIRMASGGEAEVNCVAALVRSFGWRSVIVVYEDDVFSTGDSGMVSLLSDALRAADAQIEHRLVLPPASSPVSDARSVVHEELVKVLAKQSRVFVVLKLSPLLAHHLFRKAREMELVGADSAWIVTGAVADLLHSMNDSVIFSMNGVLGIQSFHSRESAYRDFSDEFRIAFHRQYSGEGRFEPGFASLRAADSVGVIAQAVERFAGGQLDSPRLLLYLKSSNITGLTGKIRFRNGEIDHGRRLFQIVNVIGNGYRGLGFWSPEYGFSTDGRRYGVREEELLTAKINWPGDLRNVPKGWAMPTAARKLQIVVPGRTSFEKFVKVDRTKPIGFSGFCIEVFTKALDIIEERYVLPYELHRCNCTYNDLIDLVHNKTFDAAVGDITILEERMNRVEFTQPYAESGLRMIVPWKSEKPTPWIFVKPFTVEMWLVTLGTMTYTMFVVWFLEHRNNSSFRGSWRDQLGTTLWFTFSSLFFAHSEKINSNLTRVVVTAWLFIVFILTASYTASLSSMLTVQKLTPNVTDILWIKSTNQKIGCDGDSFVLKYIEEVLKLKSRNIIEVDNEYKYVNTFEEQKIAASFLEAPYAKAFLNQYCKQYTVTAPTYRFGGLAFAFQKGSPIAEDFSRAILRLSEDGTLEDLESSWFAPSAECSSESNVGERGSLSLKSFWGLYLVSGTISTLCFAVFLVLLLKSFHHMREEILSPEDKGLWIKGKRLAQYFHDKNFRTPDLARTAGQHSDDDGTSSDWDCVTVESSHPQLAPDHSPSP